MWQEWGFVGVKLYHMWVLCGGGGGIILIV
jgi:hypothetical protein